MSNLSKVFDRITDRQTRLKLYTTPLCGWLKTVSFGGYVFPFWHAQGLTLARSCNVHGCAVCPSFRPPVLGPAGVYRWFGSRLYNTAMTTA